MLLLLPMALPPVLLTFNTSRIQHLDSTEKEDKREYAEKWDTEEKGMRCEETAKR